MKKRAVNTALFSYRKECELLDFLGNSFRYNGQSSELYGLRFLELDVPESKTVGCKKIYNTQFLKNSHHRVIVSSEYGDESCISFEAEIFTDHVIPDEDYEEIFAWLFEESDYRPLYIDSDKYDQIYFNCTLNDVEVIKKGIGDDYGVVGFKFTVNCDAGWGWEHVEKEFTSTNFIANGTNLPIKYVAPPLPKDYTYPKLTLITGSTGGTCYIENKSEFTQTDENVLTRFSNLQPLTTITMNYEELSIDYTGTNNIWECFESKRWFRLIPGVNTFHVYGDVSKIKIEYERARLI